MKFDLKELIHESKMTLLSPREYFSTMSPGRGWVDIMIKSLIFGLLAGVIGAVYALTGLTGRQPGISLFSIIAGNILLFPLVTMVLLFIGGGLMTLLSLICGGNTAYKLNVQAQASLFVLLPVNMFLNVAGIIGVYLSILVSIAMTLYSFWLLYNALVHGLSAKPLRARVVVIILSTVIVLLFTAMVAAYRYSIVLSQKVLEKHGLSFEDLQKEMQSNPEAAQKRIEQMMNEYMKQNREGKSQE